MMQKTLVTLSLGALAAASSMAKRQAATVQSYAVELVVNVTEPNPLLEIDPQNWVIYAAHSGAGTNFALAQPASVTNTAAVWWFNGTASEVENGQATLATNLGTDNTDFSLFLQSFTTFDEPQYADEHIASINIGQGSPVEFTTTPNAYLVNDLALGDASEATFLLCNNTIAEYDNDYYFQLAFRYDLEIIPGDCVAINLVPQCATLNPNSPDGVGSGFTNLMPCYPAVDEVKWN